MAVTPDFREFARDQLEQVRKPITIKSMFGGAGVYCDGLIFALLSSDKPGLDQKARRAESL